MTSVSRSPNILHPEMWLSTRCYSVFTLTANVWNPENLKVQREFMASNIVNINLIFVLYYKYVCSSIEDKVEEKISCSCKHVYKVYWNNAWVYCTWCGQIVSHSLLAYILYMGKISYLKFQKYYFTFTYCLYYSQQAGSCLGFMLLPCWVLHRLLARYGCPGVLRTATFLKKLFCFSYVAL